MVRLIGLALVLVICVGCVGGPEESQDKRLGAYVLSTRPQPLPLSLDVDFDGKITLLGAAVEPASSATPGQEVHLTLYWEAKRNVGSGWSLFTHLLDGSGERLLNLDNVGPLRQWNGSTQPLGPSAWKVGKIYVDRQDFTLPPNLKGDRIQLVTGLWRGDERMAIRSGPHDGENRALIVELRTSATGAHRRFLSTRVPSVRIDRLAPGTTINIDGKLEEAAWQRAPQLGPFVEVGSGEPNQSTTLGGIAKLAWDKQYLYMAFSIRDAKVTGGFDTRAVDPHLWTRDTVEVMIDPDGDGDNEDYYEIQINPQNLVFDSRFDHYNTPKVEPNGPFGHQDWSARLTSAVTIQGTLDQEQDEDQGYTVEAKIPWRSLGHAEHAPPRVGDEWRMNFYAMRNNGGYAWSPILGQGNFHKASRFGRVLWAETGYVAPDLIPALPAASAAASGVAVPPMRSANSSPLLPKFQAAAPPSASAHLN